MHGKKLTNQILKGLDKPKCYCGQASTLEQCDYCSGKRPVRTEAEVFRGLSDETGRCQCGHLATMHENEHGKMGFCQAVLGTYENMSDCPCEGWAK